jgi:hypothetical protein
MNAVSFSFAGVCLEHFLCDPEARLRTDWDFATHTEAWRPRLDMPQRIAQWCCWREWMLARQLDKRAACYLPDVITKPVGRPGYPDASSECINQGSVFVWDAKRHRDMRSNSVECNAVACKCALLHLRSSASPREH